MCLTLDEDVDIGLFALSVGVVPQAGCTVFPTVLGRDDGVGLLGAGCCRAVRCHVERASDRDEPVLRSVLVDDKPSEGAIGGAVANFPHVE